MARLPIAGSDDGTWGTILNDFLGQAHTVDGTLKADSVGSVQIADGAVTEAHLDAPTQAKLTAPDQVTLSDAATIALDASTSDRFYVTLAGNRTLGAPTGTGTLTDGATFVLRAKASGADRTLSMAAGTGGFVFGAQFTNLPTIVSGSVLVVGCMWNATGNNWYVTSYASGY